MWWHRTPFPQVGRSIDLTARGDEDEDDEDSLADIPFEFVGEVASTRALAEASHVERGTTSRHGV